MSELKASFLHYLIFCFFVVGLNNSSYSAPRPPGPPKIPDYARTVRVPEHLFHWLSGESLRALSKQAVGSMQMPIKTLAYGSAFNFTFPKMSFRPGMFAWSNPITGMGTMSERLGDELYSRPRTQLYDIHEPEPTEPPRMIVMKIRPTARVQVVALGPSLEQDQRTFPDTDLILHMRFDYAGDLLLQEWIILNPDVVEKYSADPEVGKKFANDELNRIQNRQNQLSQYDIHFFSNPSITKFELNLPPRYQEAFSEFMTSGSNGIPGIFLKAVKNSCSSLFL